MEDDIRFYLVETSLTLQQIADRLGISFKRVWTYSRKNFSKEERKNRKVKNYSRSKLGVLNPMTGKFLEAHPNYVGVVSDNKGYWMVLKPSWYTGRPKSKHVFLHHVVVCQNLGITQIPKGFNVHHCDGNPENNEFNNLVLLTMRDHTRLHRYLKGATTISKESTLKWVEAHGTPWRRDDIVSSAWEHAAVNNG